MSLVAGNAALFGYRRVGMFPGLVEIRVAGEAARVGTCSGAFRKIEELHFACRLGVCLSGPMATLAAMFLGGKCPMSVFRQHLGLLAVAARTHSRSGEGVAWRSLGAGDGRQQQ